MFIGALISAVFFIPQVISSIPVRRLWAAELSMGIKREIALKTPSRLNMSVSTLKKIMYPPSCSIELTDEETLWLIICENEKF